MTAGLIDPSAAADMARGVDRERWAEISHISPPEVDDLTEIDPEIIDRELGRLSRQLAEEYRRIEGEQSTEGEAEQIELLPEDTAGEEPQQPSKQKRSGSDRPPRSRLKTPKQRAWADTRPDLKPFPYGTGD